MSLGELAAYVCSHLESRNIRAVLSGGAEMTLYSTHAY